MTTLLQILIKIMYVPCQGHVGFTPVCVIVTNSFVDSTKKCFITFSCDFLTMLDKNIVFAGTCVLFVIPGGSGSYGRHDRFHE